MVHWKHEGGAKTLHRQQAHFQIDWIGKTFSNVLDSARV